ncbi:hypothetical protein GGTG_03886 [Gaeumannomyces tritici R3-111a-1]|uniref:Uncharacterized protein n=1 Tax=Gaeumannomyces tritici (strain R3-111a-1) TaxID=644352 RepID=J3NRI2_GAET3|nr:hypothetical protein GGTG_03886 [Gaeumannomyces tritici R3-111a-1]EJT78788.1 hypothetical protein GGTG_03886 [Gaeumannomyces tritici R3-111a-1]
MEEQWGRLRRTHLGLSLLTMPELEVQLWRHSLLEFRSAANMGERSMQARVSTVQTCRFSQPWGGSVCNHGLMSCAGRRAARRAGELQGETFAENNEFLQ